MLVKFRLTTGKHYARANGRSVIVYVDRGTKKETTGSHCLIPGDVIECCAEKLKHFKDRFEQVDPDPPPPTPTVGLIAIDLLDGTFDVLNSVTGEPINDKPLPEATALEMAGSKRGVKIYGGTVNEADQGYTYTGIADDATAEMIEEKTAVFKRKMMEYKREKEAEGET